MFRLDSWFSGRYIISHVLRECEYTQVPLGFSGYIMASGVRTKGSAHLSFFGTDPTLKKCSASKTKDVNKMMMMMY